MGTRSPGPMVRASHTASGATSTPNPTELSPFGRLVRELGDELNRGEATMRAALRGGGSLEAEKLLARRFAVVNVWKPIGWPVEVAPLAVCDARTIGPGDLVPTDLLYRDRKGEVYSMRFAPKHRWYYFPRMRPDEAMLLKCYDSAHDRARFTAHSAFDDPTSPVDARSRESIEVRTLAFF